MSAFVKHVHVQFCFYHLTQSIRHKTQALGLPNMYETTDDFGLFSGQIDALAFLSVDEFTDGMIHLKDTAPEEAETLLEYFDATYVSGQLHPRRHHDGLRLSFRRTPPTLLPYRWNMHEGWNNRFHTLVGQNHPTTWKLIETLQAECAPFGVFIQYERCIRPKRKKKTGKIYTEPQKRLHNLCEDRLAGRKSFPEFLHGMSHNLRAGKPNI